MISANTPEQMHLLQILAVIASSVKSVDTDADALILLLLVSIARGCSLQVVSYYLDTSLYISQDIFSCLSRLQMLLSRMLLHA